MTRRVTLEERFWSKVAIAGPNDCWIWQASLSCWGYGKFSIRGKDHGAHRVAFQLWWGVSLPRWLDVCHDCPGGDNKACCNPAHLSIGDRKAHAADTKAKGQYASGERLSARMREVAARGERTGMYTHPERRPRGERNGQYTHPERTARGEQNGNSKLTELQVIGIMARWLQGIPKKQIAREFGISDVTAGHIINGKTWAHLFREASE